MESHHHEHNHQLTSLNKAFIIGITLNIAFVIVEFGVGFYYNSLGLLSDAGHNLGDVASLVLAMLAFRLQKVHTPLMRLRVVCGLCDTIAIFSPTRRFRSVDFPTFGRPAMVIMAVF